MNLKFRIVISVICLSTVLACGCKKNEEPAPAPQKTEAAPVSTPQTQPASSQGFSSALPPELAGKSITSGGTGFAEALNSKRINDIKVVDVKSEDGFEIAGWAVNGSTKSVPETIIIELTPVKGGDNFYATAYRSYRDDIAKSANVPAYKKAGFMMKTDIKSVPPGEYDINIIQVDNGNALRTSSTKKLNKTN
jgi:hypothetical protein